jgi:hypothetical protein
LESQDLHPDDRVNHSDGAAMNGFVDLHGESITGVIETFDRVIFKGHLNGFFPDGAFGRYLSRRGILLKDAGPAILNLHERIENKLFLDRTRKDSNFKRPHIYATLFQIEKC